MPMTLVVTRNVASRTRGFLASCLCEIAPGVYTGPRISKAVRERIWQVLCEWFGAEGEDSGIVMTWPDAQAAGGQAFLILGSPQTELYELDGMYVVRGQMTKESYRSLKIEQPSTNTSPEDSKPNIK
jgi:CRISPR-associated protein Cas2